MAKKKDTLLTKVASGVNFGDVSNQAIRNILTEISKELCGKFTEQEMEDTLEYFDWKCPYTGRDLRNSIANQDGTYATDHIYPQNRDWCGLNVMGNLVIVDKKANSHKRDKDVETFLLTDTKSLGTTDLATRQARLQKIREFQKDHRYDPEAVRDVIQPIMLARYDNVRAEQEKWIKDALDQLESAKVISFASAKTAPTAPLPAAKKSGSKAHSTTPELIFHATDEEHFKNALLTSKKAHFVLTYNTGIVKLSHWNAAKFQPSSNLRSNIESKAFWRSHKAEGLVKVEVFLD